ncbi:MAG TPA: hypothetical protein VFQ36_01305 [Ktedonobacteraceae bacterium]|nr:hypothetical protein [Ktedonobacteraceae bacterium]
MMSQQYRFVRLPLVGVVLIGLLAGLYLAAARKRPAKSDDAGAVASHKIDTPAEDALKYWTDEKMRDAKPAEMPKVKGLKRGKKRPKRPKV